MKNNIIKVIRTASMLSMLAFGTSYAMEDLGSYVNIRSLGVKLAELGLAKDKKITAKDLLGLYEHLEWDTVLGLFNLDQATAETYINTDKVKRFIKFVNDKDEDAQALKITSLKKSLNYPACEEALECTNLQICIEALVDLHYYTGNQEGKIALIDQLRQALDDLRPEDAEGTLKYEEFLNIPAAQELLDQMREGKEVTQAEFLRTLCLDTLVDQLDFEQLQGSFHLGNVLTLILSLMLAESSDGLPSKLLLCLKWDTLVDYLPDLLDCTKQELNRWLNPAALKQLLRAVQANKKITPQQISAIIQNRLLGPFIDEESAALTLMSLRKGNIPYNLKEVVKLKELGDVLGCDMESMFNTSLPEEAQKHAIAEFVDLFTYDGLFESIKEQGRNCLAVLPLIWSAYHYPYLLGGISMAAGGLYYFTGINKKSERSMIVMVNMAATKATRFLNCFMQPSFAKKLIAKTNHHPQQEALASFIQQCEEHLCALERPIAIFSIFDGNEVYTFICKNEAFIEHLCTGGFEQDDERQRAKRINGSGGHSIGGYLYDCFHPISRWYR